MYERRLVPTDHVRPIFGHVSSGVRPARNFGRRRSAVTRNASHERGRLQSANLANFVGSFSQRRVIQLANKRIRNWI